MSGTFYRYCAVCGTRLGSADFVSGRAVRDGHDIRCVDCVKQATRNGPPVDPGKRRPTDTRRHVISC